MLEKLGTAPKVILMASSVISEIILFIVSLLVAGTIAGGLYIVTQDLADGISTRGAIIAQNLRVDFTIINDPENIPVLDEAYVFYIKNTGSEEFSFTSSTIIVFIDGNLIPPSNLTLTPSTLYPYDIGELRISTTLSSGYHKLVVVIESGKQREFAFKI